MAQLLTPVRAALSLPKSSATAFAVKIWLTQLALAVGNLKNQENVAQGRGGQEGFCQSSSEIIRFEVAISVKRGVWMADVCLHSALDMQLILSIFDAAL